jgi:hypothetical protein
VADLTIYIREDGDKFVVSIDPPMESEPDKTFDAHKEARGYAGGLRLVKGGTLVDTTGWTLGIGMMGRRAK